MPERKIKKEILARSPLLQAFLSHKTPIVDLNQWMDATLPHIQKLDSEIKADIGENWDTLTLYPIVLIVEKFPFLSKKLDLLARLNVYFTLFGIGYELGDMESVHAVKETVCHHLAEAKIINESSLDKTDKLIEGLMEAGARIKTRDRDIKDLL